MQRITDPTAQADKHGAGKNGWTEGTPGLVAPSVARAEWFDGVQEEICNAIEAAGLTPAIALTQLTAAIRLLGLGTYCLLDVSGSSDGTTKMTLAIAAQSGGFTVASNDITAVPTAGRYLCLFSAPEAVTTDVANPSLVELAFALGAAAFSGWRPTASASDVVPLYGWGVVNSASISLPWSLKASPFGGTVSAGVIAKLLTLRLPG